MKSPIKPVKPATASASGRPFSSDRYQLLIPVGPNNSDRREVLDSMAERPTRSILCTTSLSYAKRIVEALNFHDKNFLQETKEKAK